MPFRDHAAASIAVPFTGNPLDRADGMRERDDALEQTLRAPEARLLTLCEGRAPIGLEPSPSLVWTSVSPRTLAAASSPPVFLGLEDGAGRFAVDLPEGDDPAALGLWPQPPKFIDLRSIGADLPAGEAAIFAEAKSLLSWHVSHRFCAQCGAESVMSRGGWRRDCSRCDGKHFPRTDPVVIMLVARRPETGEDRLVMGRQRHWPPGMYSLLAGYVEPGESIEEAVRRETQEESGVKIGRVSVLASQPWPFPSTLMIGCLAEALSDELTPDTDELEDVRWIGREELTQVVAGEHPTQTAPRRDAIARVLIEAWLDGRAGF